MAVLTHFVRAHTPLIKFLGPRHLLRNAQPAAAAASAAASAPRPAAAPASSTYSTAGGEPGVKRGTVPFSDAEIEAIQLGGAGFTLSF
ncbi:hypothetical protein AMAG_15377 [Allomyces macrogynus ATCC 38327]|uniref:Uncharacterized protein n=1 Tax=Allomyces macrogynus (strain ATCC 38327) TaxID=578462 RepID=A0A0L0T7A2_ALLM3|nr:hypothetical protein AMAG_15377 [Allomyces macrogynus ATCC 38327]|eukprot:KNE70622.1 hypothetical protein AMAG_15377 [Allomyces macrogynus ATCC 38327]